MVQLIQEANFGSGRFEPYGPALSQTPPAAAYAEPTRGMDALLLSPPVENKPEACAGDFYTCDGRSVRPGGVSASWGADRGDAPVRVEVEVRERAVPTILPSDLAGSLLDVLA